MPPAVSQCLTTSDGYWVGGTVLAAHGGRLGYLSQQLGDERSEGGAGHHHPPGRGRGRGGDDSGLDLRGGRPEGGSRARLFSKRTLEASRITKICFSSIHYTPAS